jgi:hypothetical protein
MYSHYIFSLYANWSIIIHPSCGHGLYSSSMEIPQALKRFLSHFPLRTYPPIEVESTTPSRPTLWISPPSTSDGVLSTDVECLKWQAGFFISLSRLNVDRYNLSRHT